MRTIVLLQNTRGAWFVHTESAGNIVSQSEDYSTLAHAQRAFITEGRHQPFARMLVEVPGRAKPILIRPAKALPPDGISVEVVSVHIVAVRNAMTGPVAKSKH